ncbi:hypothetical protein AB0M54_09545 [Actinoplanes sp. NPDC051470]|uniref:hypothetical protein n=1 Tax=unclassified Actinoplanes TaxID=2626549 RepID=UPI0034368BF6
MPAEAARPARHRQATAGGLRRAGRLRELLAAGVVDSFGMALGWTVLVLLAVDRGGLAEAALYNAAMLAGVVLSAPITGWLARRLPGRILLRSTAGAEIVLRVAVLWGLIAGAPTWSLATGILIMHIVAWTGFAGMRAEVSAVAPGPKAMTRYALGIAAVEAAGTGLAALLPAGAAGHPTGWWLAAVFVVYAGSLLPTIAGARRARVRPDETPTAGIPALALSGRRVATHVPSSPARRRTAVSPKLLAAGGGVMLLASGPTLLAVPLTTELHGRTWVAGAAVAFSLGCLLATVAVEAIGSMRLPAVLRWSLFGLGMLVGWMFAPAHAYAVLFAQFAAGLSQTAFEGDMDARVAAEAPLKGVTTALAYSASVRALGGSVAVKALPLMVTAQSVDRAVSAAALVLGLAALLLYTATLIPRRARKSQPASV